MKQTKFIFSITLIVSLFSAMALNAGGYYTIPDDTTKSKEDMVINSKYGYTYGDSVECVKNLSLYRDYYKQWKNSKYENETMLMSAMQFWRVNCDVCPKVSLNLYIRGSKMIEYKIESATDSLQREQWIDTLMMLYDKRIENFGDHPKYGKDKVLGYKALDLFKYRKELPAQYYPLFEEAFETGGINTSASTLQGYFSASAKMANIDSIPWSEVIYDYLDIKEVVDYNLTKEGISKRDSLRYKKTDNYLDRLMVAIAKCDNIEKIFTPEYLKDSTNVELLRAIIRLSDIRQCTDHKLYFRAAKQLHSIEPSPLSAFSIGKLSMKKEDYETAEGYLKEATETYSDSLADRKSDAYLLYAECLRNLNKYSSARSAARSSINLKENNARAYIIIGDMYASSASSCEFKGLKTAYWVAYDEYSKAYNAAKEEKIKEVARKKMSVMKSNFPPGEEVFMRNLTDGANFKVECWINQSTKVRTK